MEPPGGLAELEDGGDQSAVGRRLVQDVMELRVALGERRVVAGVEHGAHLVEQPAGPAQLFV